MSDEFLDSYADIIDLEYHGLSQYPRMPLSERAAQFSPFAALTGYDDLIDETVRHSMEDAPLAEEEWPQQADDML